MRREWEQEAQSLVIRDESPNWIVAALMKRELVDRLPWIIGGLLFAFPGTFAAGYIVSFMARDYMEAFILGFLPSLLGLGIIGTQIVFLHEGVHHTVFKPTNWIPGMRKWMPPLAFIITSYLLFFFIPVEDPTLIWKHPAIKVTDALLVTLLGIISPYLTKIGYDYFPLTPKGERSIWRVSLILIGIYFLIATTIITLFSPSDTSLSDIVVHVSLVTIPLFGVLYVVKWNLRNQRDNRDHSAGSEISQLGYIETVRDSKILTFLAAVCAGAWLPILAGASAAVNAGFSPSLGVEPGLFIFGYVNLFFTIWILLFGPILVGGMLLTLVYVAIRIFDRTL